MTVQLGRSRAFYGFAISLFVCACLLFILELNLWIQEGQAPKLNCTAQLISPAVLPDRTNHLGIGPGIACMVCSVYMLYLRHQIKENFFGHPEHQFAFYGYFFVLSFVASGLSLSHAVFEFIATLTFRDSRVAVEYGLHVTIGMISLWDFVIATGTMITGIAYLLRDPMIPVRMAAPTQSMPTAAAADMTYNEDDRESPIVRYHDSVVKASVMG